MEPTSARRRGNSPRLSASMPSFDRLPLSLDLSCPPTASMDGVAGLAQLRGVTASLLLGEKAAIADAAGEREAFLLRLDRELTRSKNVPHHERPAEVGVRKVTAVVGKTELAGCVLPDA